MLLDFNAFRMIKPKGVMDDYEAGQGVNGGYEMCAVEKGKLYRSMIIELLTKKGGMTSKAIAVELGLRIKSVASILQKLTLEGRAVKGDKVIGISGRKTYTYKLPEVEQ